MMELQKLPYEIFSLTDMPSEVWKDITGYEGLYQISTMGRIKGLPKKINNGAIRKN